LATKNNKLNDFQWWKKQALFLLKGNDAFANDTEHQMILIRLLLGVAIPTLFIFAIVHWQIGHHELALVQTVGLIFVTIALFLTSRPKWVTVAEKILMISALCIFLALMLDGVVERTGIYWGAIVPLLCILHGWPETGMEMDWHGHALINRHSLYMDNKQLSTRLQHGRVKIFPLRISLLRHDCSRV